MIAWTNGPRGNGNGDVTWPRLIGFAVFAGAAAAYVIAGLLS